MGKHFAEWQRKALRECLLEHGKMLNGGFEYDMGWSDARIWKEFFPTMGQSTVQQWRRNLVGELINKPPPRSPKATEPSQHSYLEELVLAGLRANNAVLVALGNPAIDIPQRRPPPAERVRSARRTKPPVQGIAKAMWEYFVALDKSDWPMCSKREMRDHILKLGLKPGSSTIHSQLSNWIKQGKIWREVGDDKVPRYGLNEDTDVPK